MNESMPVSSRRSGRAADPRSRGAEHSVRSAGLDLLAFETILEHESLNVTLYDRDCVVRAVSRTAARLAGMSREEMRGRSLRDHLPPAYLRSIERSLAGESLEVEDRVAPEVCPEETWTRAQLMPVRDGSGDVQGGLVVVTDITEAKRSGELVEKLAYFDTLTGLPNRAMLTRLLEHSLSGGKGSPRRPAVVWLNLDRFKHVNDALGQATGDRLLRAVAERLSETVRANDLLARVAADDFLIVLQRVNSRAHLERLLARLQACFAAPFVFDATTTIYVTASCGVALRSAGGSDADRLQEQAHTAMRGAKARGGDCYHILEEAGSQASSEKIRLAREIREGIRRGEFVLHYQPQLDLEDEDVVGLEALVRWQHPRPGLLSPAAFIPFAEESGLIVDLGRSLIDQVCTQLRDWMSALEHVPRIAFNVSAREFQRTDVCEQVKRSAEKAGVPTTMLEVEITETAVLADPARAAAVAQALRDAGLTVTLDDFGTGYSSLTHLRQFPIDRVKVDRTFVANCLTDPSAAAIVEAVSSLAHRLGLEVVAEGVETVEQLAYVRAVGCDLAQGYYFARPMAPEECAAYLTGRSARLS